MLDTTKRMDGAQKSRRCWMMGHLRVVPRTGAIVLAIGLLTLVGCTFLQPKVDVDFAASETKGVTPLLVEFTALVAGDAVAYYWDFGDGETSTDSSPVHVYHDAGTYDVFLTVTLADGSTGAAEKDDLIEVESVGRKASQDSMLYWLNTSSGTIYRGDRVGYSSETVVSYVYRGKDLAVGGGYVYWAEDDTVYRANYDGSDQKAIVTNQPGLQSVAVDGVADKIYWACTPSGPFSQTYWKGSLKRADLTGTGRTTLEEYDDSAYSYTWLIRSDEDGGKLYRYFDDDNYVRPVRLTPRGLWDGRIQWLEFPTASTPTIHRVKGSMNGISTMALDVSDGPARYVYWITGSSIKRCRVDGSDTTTILRDLDYPKGVAVDIVEGKMYWSDKAGIHRADFDGTGDELIYPGVRADILVIQQ
jgi:PKD repeat protein